jgi:hypothetical protein
VIGIHGQDDKGAQNTKDITIEVLPPEPNDPAANPPIGSTLTIQPLQGEKILGATFTTQVLLSSEEHTAVAAIVDISYSDNLNFISANSENSVLRQTIKEPSPTENSLQFVRVEFAEGFIGTNGILLELTFEAINEGPAHITIQDSSRVIALEGAQDILSSVESASYSIVNKQACLNIDMPQRRLHNRNQAIAGAQVLIQDEIADQ